MRATSRRSTGTIKVYLSITGNLIIYSTSDLFPYCCFKTAGLGTNQGNLTVISTSEITYREKSRGSCSIQNTECKHKVSLNDSLLLKDLGAY